MERKRNYWLENEYGTPVSRKFTNESLALEYQRKAKEMLALFKQEWAAVRGHFTESRKWAALIRMEMPIANGILRMD